MANFCSDGEVYTTAAVRRCGTLDVRAKTITDEMCLEAALEMARTAEDRGLKDDYLIPTMDDWEVFPREAAAVGMKAIEQGVALRTDVTFEDLKCEAEAIIKHAREEMHTLMDAGLIVDADTHPEPPIWSRD